MNDYLEILNNYKDVKGVFDLIDDVQKLRFYYSNQQYETMMQHIRDLVAKYPLETAFWNGFNPAMPDTYNQAYQNAENFLRFNGIKMLIQKGYDLSQHLKQEEISFIKSMIKPME